MHGILGGMKSIQDLRRKNLSTIEAGLQNVYINRADKMSENIKSAHC
jgi:hypothetical protein